MSWMSRLYETYRYCAGNPDFKDDLHPLLPISHTSQQAHIVVAINGEGNFLRAHAVTEKTQIIIPATEASAGRTSGAAAHPLADKIHYCAKDYEGEKENRFALYSEQLENWCASRHGHPKAKAVLTYLNKGRLVHDLVEAGVMQADSEGRLLTEPPEENPSALFKMLTPKKSGGRSIRDQGDALVCWQVEIPGDKTSDTWTDTSLQESWIAYDAEQSETRQLCMVTGETASPAGQHPRNIRRPGDGAKLISSNDQSGFTFRGRFCLPGEASSVGYKTTHMAHNALRWLLVRQGHREGEQAIVAWAVKGQKIPDLFDPDWFLKDRTEEEKSSESRDTALPDHTTDAGQRFSRALAQKIRGYKKQLSPTDTVVILGLDAATPGRLSVIFYREMLAYGTEHGYLERLEQWQTDCSWQLRRSIPNKENKGKPVTIRLVCAPLPDEIYFAVYGKRPDKSQDRLYQATKERLLPCITDRAPLPRDLVDGAVHRACGWFGPEKRIEREQVLTVACALYKGFYARYPELTNGRYSMSLEKKRTSRDYLYGRLLAVAEYLEWNVLTKEEKKRPTNAERLMQRFADHPASTWPILYKQLAPYLRRLLAINTSKYVYCKKLMEEISDLFASPEIFMSRERLSGEFLLGYHCQMSDLYKAKETPTTEEEGE